VHTLFRPEWEIAGWKRAIVRCAASKEHVCAVKVSALVPDVWIVVLLKDPKSTDHIRRVGLVGSEIWAEGCHMYRNPLFCPFEELAGFRMSRHKLTSHPF
jgi:hypothetical protein